jgi:hypothetical protein
MNEIHLLDVQYDTMNRKPLTKDCLHEIKQEQIV